MQKQDNHR